LSAAPCFGLEAGGVDEDELRITLGADAGDAMACGLRLVGGDAHLLADQRIEQRGLAHIGPPDDRHQPAALRRRRMVALGR